MELDALEKVKVECTKLRDIVEVKQMIHAICDFCGKDCDRTATLLSMTPFQNFARIPA